MFSKLTFSITYFAYISASSQNISFLMCSDEADDQRYGSRGRRPASYVAGFICVPEFPDFLIRAADQL
jgi:hypothetical protein